MSKLWGRHLTGKILNIIFFSSKSVIFWILATAFMFLFNFPKRWTPLVAAAAHLLVHKFIILKPSTQPAGQHESASEHFLVRNLWIWYTKSLGFYEKLLTLMSCNFLSLGNQITNQKSGITSSSSSFEWILQILRICKLLRFSLHEMSPICRFGLCTGLLVTTLIIPKCPRAILLDITPQNWYSRSTGSVLPKKW